MSKALFVAGPLALVLLAGCTTTPDGPAIPVAPGPNKSFSEFRADDLDCQDFAHHRVAGRAERANDRAILSAIIGAGLGAALGGAVGGGEGAGIGAAAGGVAGTAYGSDRANREQGSLQRRYDIAYGQCMAAKGNDVPYFRPRGYRDRDRPPPRSDDRY